MIIYTIEYRYKSTKEQKEVCRIAKAEGFWDYLWKFIKIRITAPYFIKVYKNIKG